MAYVTVVVQSRLAGFDESLEEAAMDLGARPLRVFLRITLPLILPAIASGWLLAFTLSWDDLVITQFVAGPGSSTLPMVIFSKVRFGVTPDVNALATIMVLIVATGIAISTVWMRYRSSAAHAICSSRPRPTCEGPDMTQRCSESMWADPRSRPDWSTSTPVASAAS